LHPATP